MLNRKSVLPAGVSLPSGMFAAVLAAEVWLSAFDGNPLNAAAPVVLFLAALRISAGIPVGRMIGLLLFAVAALGGTVLCATTGNIFWKAPLCGAAAGLLLRESFRGTGDGRSFAVGKFFYAAGAALGFAAAAPGGGAPAVAAALSGFLAFAGIAVRYGKEHPGKRGAYVFFIGAILLCGCVSAAVAAFRTEAEAPVRRPVGLQADLILSMLGPEPETVLVSAPENSLLPAALRLAPEMGKMDSLVWGKRPPSPEQGGNASGEGATSDPRGFFRSCEGETYRLIVLELPREDARLTTRESFAELRNILRPDGLLAVIPDDSGLDPETALRRTAAVRNAMKTVFPNVIASTCAPMLLASAAPIEPERIIRENTMLGIVKPLLFPPSHTKRLNKISVPETPSDSLRVTEEICFRGSVPQEGAGAFCLRIYDFLAAYRYFCAGLLILGYLIFRYAAAYTVGAGAVAAIFERAFCIGGTVVILIAGRCFESASSGRMQILALALGAAGTAVGIVTGCGGTLGRILCGGLACAFPFGAWLLLPGTGEWALIAGCSLILAAGWCGGALQNSEIRRYDGSSLPYPAMACAEILGFLAALLISGLLLPPWATPIPAATAAALGALPVFFRR